MPIIDHNNVPEVPWRPGYRKWDVTLEEHVTNCITALQGIEGELGLE